MTPAETPRVRDRVLPDLRALLRERDPQQRLDAELVPRPITRLRGVPQLREPI